MPSLGADMTHGTLVEWRVKPGDLVRRGDIVAEVETEKGVFEVDIRVDGVVEELLVVKGAKVPVGTALARLGATVRDGAAVAATAAAPSLVVPPPPEPAPTPVPPALTPHPPTPSATRTRVRASPLARRIATELGIDLRAVTPSDEGGTITRADVERAARGNGTSPGSAAAIPAVAPSVEDTAGRSSDATRMAAMRRAIGAAVAKSKREIPHYYLSQDIDVGHAMEWLRVRNLERSVDQRLLPATLLIKAVARAAVAFPEFNGFWIEGDFRASPEVHVGVAISLRGGGLIAPALHNADQQSLDQLMPALRDLVQRTRAGGLRTSELIDATITVTNLGDLGVQSAFGVIYPPQVAIVGFGAIAERPWAHEGLLGVRPIVTATLAADHRVSDGHRGGLFLAEIARQLAAPEAL
jgi:pyruvate dehydrogenase E2 component (dihydrolipoamide acetyltransferase)